MKRTRADHFDDRLDDLVLAGLHAGRADLSDDHLAIAVEHEARQAVRFPVGEAIVRRIIQPLAQRERHLQPVHEQRLPRREAAVATEDPRADERMGIDVGVAEEAVAVAHHAAGGAGRKVRERRSRRVHLVAEDPQVAGCDAAVLARLEPQLGQVLAFARRVRGVRHR